MSGAHDWPLLYSVPRWRQEEEALAPLLLWQEDLLKKKIGKFKKNIPSNHHGITLSTDRYGQILSRIVILLKDFGLLPCLVATGMIKIFLPFRDGLIFNSIYDIRGLF